MPILRHGVSGRLQQIFIFSEPFRGFPHTPNAIVSTIHSDLMGHAIQRLFVEGWIKIAQEEYCHEDHQQLHDRLMQIMSPK
jgi:hypothetical protein